MSAALAAVSELSTESESFEIYCPSVLTSVPSVSGSCSSPSFMILLVVRQNI